MHFATSLVLVIFLVTSYGQECPPLVSPPGSSLIVTCRTNGPVRPICRLSCPPGRLLVGGITSVICRQPGIWSNVLTRSACVYDDRCPSRRGRRQTTEEVSICSTCSGSCPRGEICCPAGCGSICTPIPPSPSTCPSLGSIRPPLTFSYNCTNGNNIGSSCRLGCRFHGHVLIGGSRLLICRRNGVWNQNVRNIRCDFDQRCPPPPTGPSICPICPITCPPGETCCSTGCGSQCVQIIRPRPRQCPVLMGPPDSQLRIRCSRGRRIGSRCILTCPRFHRLLGNVRFVICRRNRRWSQSIRRSSCVPETRRCPALGSIRPPVRFLYNCTRNNLVGSFCRLTCPLQGHVIRGGSPRLICRPNGWNQNVQRLSCGYDERCPPPPPFGICLVCPSVCPPGQICCSTGCGSACRDIPECPRLITPPNSRVIFRCTARNRTGSRCFLTCPRNHRLVGGVRSVICQNTGRWSQSVIRSACVPISSRRCPALGSIVPAPRFIYNCTRSNRVGSVCRLTCAEPGRVIRGGRDRLFCLFRGWNQDVQRLSCGFDERCPPVPPFGVCPICPPTCPSGQICCSTGCGSTCQDIPECPPLTTPPGSRVSFICTSGRRSGSRCTLRCPRNHRLVGGVRSVTCRNTGVWTISVIRSACLPSPQTCPSLGNIRPPVNFDYDCNRGNRVSSRCRLSCPRRGHVIIRGGSALACLPTGRWSQRVTRIRCGFDPRCRAVARLGFVCIRRRQCPPRCPRGDICCPTRCGSSCVDISRG